MTPAQQKNLPKLIWFFSIAVPIIVGILVNPRLHIKIDPGFDPFILPKLNATINSLVSICLVIGLVMIKRGQKEIHRRFMVSAFVLSAIFLVSYVLYHLSAGSQPYCADNLAPKWLYFVILFTHIPLSVFIIPLASFSIFRALSEQYDRHKKLARITFPLWLYVSVTGVLVVVMNSACYG
ncbi:MAG: DUF420 domain-containing protein [Bacteroidota bacterium]